jgi:arylsulfatase A-like enzyme
VENTLVLLTSDNGGLWHAWRPEETDDKAGYQPTPRAIYNAERGHHSNGPLRGTKADIWEGGHRVPFIVCWPARVEGGAVSRSLVELTDVLATFAGILDARLLTDAGEDSISFLPALLNPSGAGMTRRLSVHHSSLGFFALREGPWKFVPSRGSGGFSTPRTVAPRKGEPEGQLYHLEDDPAETRNVWQQHPEIVTRLAERLRTIQAGPGIATPRGTPP